MGLPKLSPRRTTDISSPRISSAITVTLPAVDAVGHAATDVVLQKDSRNGIGRGARGRYLLEDVHAVPVLLRHAPEASHLALHPVQPPDEGSLVGGVGL